MFFEMNLGGGGGSQVKVGEGSTATSSYKVNVGFKPKFFILVINGSTSTSTWTAGTLVYYNVDMFTDKFYRATSSNSLAITNMPYPTSSNGGIVSIDNDGVTMSKSGNVFAYKYIAIG